VDAPLAIQILFPASNYRLLDVVRRTVDDSALRTIAEADYGIGAVQHLTELLSIRDSGVVPSTVESWEALVLTAFSEPNGDIQRISGSTERGHRMRAFACSVILRAEFEGAGGAMAETAVAQCLASARVLGEEVNTAVGSFLTWAMPLVHDAGRWLYALGLLIAASRVPSRLFADDTLGEVAEWVLAEEDMSRGRSHGLERPPAPFGLQQGFWSPLASELVERTATIDKKAIRDDLELLGRFVLGAV
jgi:hypothetical protein